MVLNNEPKYFHRSSFASFYRDICTGSLTPDQRKKTLLLRILAGKKMCVAAKRKERKRKKAVHGIRERFDLMYYCGFVKSLKHIVVWI